MVVRLEVWGRCCPMGRGSAVKKKVQRKLSETKLLSLYPSSLSLKLRECVTWWNHKSQNHTFKMYMESGGRENSEYLFHFVKYYGIFSLLCIIRFLLVTSFCLASHSACIFSVKIVSPSCICILSCRRALYVPGRAFQARQAVREKPL